MYERVHLLKIERKFFVMKHEKILDWNLHDRQLLELYDKLGPTWSKIQKSMPFTTVAAIRNRYKRIAQSNVSRDWKQICSICKKPRRGHSIVYCQAASKDIDYETQSQTASDTDDLFSVAEEVALDFGLDDLPIMEVLLGEALQPNLALDAHTQVQEAEPEDTAAELDCRLSVKGFSSNPDITVQSVQPQTIMFDNNLLWKIQENEKQLNILEHQTNQLQLQLSELCAQVERNHFTQQLHTNDIVAAEISTVSDSASSSFRRHFLKQAERSILISFYNTCEYPDMQEKQVLGSACNMSVKQVENWFCNRRKRDSNRI